MMVWNKRRLVLPLLALGLALALAAVQTPALRAQGEQTITPTDVVRNWIDSLNRHDEAGQRLWTDPNAHLMADPGTADAVDEAFADHIKTLGEDAAVALHWEITAITQTAPDTVVVATIITTNDLPPLPHPVTVTFTFTVSGAKVTRVVGITSAQTKQDFADLENGVGMPRTGSPDQQPALLALLAGLLILLCGALLRRAPIHSR